MPGPLAAADGSAQLAEEQVDNNEAVSNMAAPKDLSFPLRLSPHTTLHIQLTLLTTSTLILLTTKSQSSSSPNSALGSFVYAMPNVPLPLLEIRHVRLVPDSAPLSTPLYALPSSIEFATRVAKIIAKRTKKPTYVGCSVVFEGATVEEEMEGIHVAVTGILQGLGEEAEKDPVVNGVQ